VWSFHVSSFFVFVVGLCVRARKTESAFSVFVVGLCVRARKTESFYSDRKMNCGEKKPQLYGEIHDAVILSDVLFVVDVVGTNLILGLWDAWCF
jgi:hypothetical protein